MDHCKSREFHVSLGLWAVDYFIVAVSPSRFLAANYANDANRRINNFFDAPVRVIRVIRCSEFEAVLAASSFSSSEEPDFSIHSTPSSRRTRYTPAPDLPIRIG